MCINDKSLKGENGYEAVISIIYEEVWLMLMLLDWAIIEIYGTYKLQANILLATF